MEKKSRIQFYDFLESMQKNENKNVLGKVRDLLSAPVSSSNM